jgi:hypothetical protein
VSAIDREVLDRFELAVVLQNANPLDVDENAAADEAIMRREATLNRAMI